MSNMSAFRWWCWWWRFLYLYTYLLLHRFDNMGLAALKTRFRYHGWEFSEFGREASLVIFIYHLLDIIMDICDAPRWLGYLIALLNFITGEHARHHHTAASHYCWFDSKDTRWVFDGDYVTSDYISRDDELRRRESWPRDMRKMSYLYTQYSKTATSRQQWRRSLLLCAF